MWPVSDGRRRDADLEAWDWTDRPLRFPARAGKTKTSTHTSPPDADGRRFRWLVENDVRTEFVDAGIGCCWFAYQGDREPVCGETEDAAIARMAQENGLDLWREG